ncbi:N-acyl-D-amino-acid deacylase family protein [Sandaracinobacteroides saxicola]|uniref:D-aminoacylase n=1 Tax=Sandaracinobacteroides saxicola TaxID=2759707 RepID=A0A7G5IGL6_9SPHN|nr:D-aminoacylase [Sandaracinobacteroides saxicola]QMW22508.1 D-aminoacylase [Sandaracinobacteroides saxicola]
MKSALFALPLFALLGTAPLPPLDTVIANGLIYDGSGGEPWRGWVGIRGDSIVALGRNAVPPAKRRIDARGQAVAPGFINMLSWATESLLVNPTADSDLVQGVTLEVMGEGWSMGPLTPAMKAEALKQQGDIKYPISWTTLRQYQDHVIARGSAVNIASFVGATTVRIHELGEADVQPTPEQLDRMRALVRSAMNEGAMGLGSSLIYAPASYAKTPELIALATESARCGGLYISHMRSEGDRLLEAVDELVEIARASGGPAEIYHLKAAGKANWGKLDAVIARVEAARAAGTRISANMYTYTAGATGLDAAMPTWVQDGGHDAWVRRLKDPAIRARVVAEMKAPGKDWENLLFGAGSADNVLFLEFRNPALKPLTGKTLAEVARMRGTSPEETAIDLVIEDDSRVGTAYFLMSEANVARQTALPWMSFGSDEAAPKPAGVFLKSNSHPRAYGNVARLLGRYVRDQRTTSLADAIRRLTSLPASNLGLTDRGRLAPGMKADVVIFDPAKVSDPATYAKPAQLATGVDIVLVNGTVSLMNGKPTAATPGRVVTGPGLGKCPA